MFGVFFQLYLDAVFHVFLFTEKVILLIARSGMICMIP